MATVRRREDGVMEIVGAARPVAPGTLSRFVRWFWGDFPARASGVKLRVVPHESAAGSGRSEAVRDAGGSGS